MKRINIRSIALYGILTALAMGLGYLESLIPSFFAVPGIKLGLTNIAVISALYLLDWKAAASVNLIRILLSAFLFGNGTSLIYSLAGGILSTVLMILLKKSGRFHVIAVSIAGGVSHNLGQILAAAVMMQTSMILWYMLVLWICGIVTGALIGLIGGEIVRRLYPVIGERQRDQAP